jgi:thymidylate synthase
MNQFSNEIGYLSLMKNILEHGEKKSNRTGVDTLSIFGCSLRFDISESFPLLTTKRVYWKGVIEELMWFLSGDTSARRLQEKGIRIWDGNTSREFLDARHLNYDEGDCGPVYGFQWRHWNAPYDTCDTCYNGAGIDQVRQVIDSIKNDPMSRRHIINSWNVEQLDQMVLPPCHVMCQFYVSNDGGLSCQMYQRSADVFLGLPFNIASYAALTYVIAKMSGLVPRSLQICIGDAHIYTNHIDAANLQLQNTPKAFPTLCLKENIDIDHLTMNDFKLMDYSHCGTIPGLMVV